MDISLNTINAYLHDVQTKQDVMYVRNVIDLFDFLKFCEKNNKDIVGIGFKRFDGIDIKETKASESYNHYIAIDKKECK